MKDGNKPSRVIDWEAIEREYRAGQLSVREIAAAAGVSHVAILKKAKRDGWERNLAAAVREKVTARLVTEGVTGKSAAETVELAAARGVQIIRDHQASIGRGQRLVSAMFEELEEGCASRDEIEAAIEEETSSDRGGTRRAAMLRAVALPSRSSVMGNLASALKTLVGLERQAFNLETEPALADHGAVERIEVVIVDAPDSDG